MSKMAGMGMKVLVDGYDISGDFQSVALRGGPAVIETTGVDVFAYERIGGRRDGGIGAVTYFNPETAADDPGTSADRSHLVLRSLPLTDRLVTVAHPTAGEAWNVVGKQGNYDPTVAADAAITCALDVQANGYGLEPARLLTPAGLATLSGTGSLAGVDFGTGDLDFGLQAHLQVIELDGTDATVTLQESSDNGVGDAWADITDGAFTTVTDRTTERIQTDRDQTIERYVRVTVDGTFTTVTFMVTVEVNLTSVEF